MFGKFALTYCVFALASLSLVVTSEAVEIDQELQDLLQAKSSRDLVPVLMVFDDPAHVDEIQGELEQASVQERRRLVLENLRRKAARTQAGVLGFLSDPVHGEKVGKVRTLYLASALSFEASPAVVEAMRALPDPATLFYDKTYDLTSGTSRGPAPAVKSLPAVVDTAWSLKYINADMVWNYLGFTGAGVVVGHIDSGIYLTIRTSLPGCGSIPARFRAMGSTTRATGSSMMSTAGILAWMTTIPMMTVRTPDMGRIPRARWPATGPAAP